MPVKASKDRRITVTVHGRRQFIRLGVATREQQREIARHVKALARAVNLNIAPPEFALRWSQGIEGRLHERLAVIGLVRPRQDVTVGGFIGQYLGERLDLKQTSRDALGNSMAKLVEFFGASARLASITPDGAREWRAKLLANGLSEATARRYSGDAKQFFNVAVKRKLIMENPFADLSSGPMARKCKRRLTPAEIAAVLTAITDIRVKVVFALGSLAGLRVSSESHSLTWADVDWEKGWLHVPSPKTEHHRGHEERWVPMCAALGTVLAEAMDAAPVGTAKVCRLSGKSTGWKSNIGRKLLHALGVAKVEKWPAIWQTLRASCETNWQAQGISANFANMMAGHGQGVSRRHYVNSVPDEIMNKIAKPVARNPARQVQETGANSGMERQVTTGGYYENPDKSGIFRDMPVRAVLSEVAATGVEPVT